MDFVKYVKSLKTSYKYAGDFGLRPGIVSASKRSWIIRDSKGEGVRVVFNNPQQELSIFQYDLCYCLFFLKKKPRDYANYFKCPAGDTFAKSILSVWVFKIVENPEIKESLVYEAGTIASIKAEIPESSSAKGGI